MKELPQEFIISALSRWGLRASTTFIRKVENFVYEIDGEDKILRVTEPEHRSPEELHSELAWMDFLANNRVHFAHPIQSEAGKLVETLTLGSSTLSAVVFQKAKGALLTEREDYNVSGIERLGQVMGKMHRVTKSYVEPEGVRPREHWESEINVAIARRTAKKLSGPMVEAFHRSLSWAQNLPQSKDCYGMIHADLHHGNYFIDRSQGRPELTVFDFDDCHYHWFAYDVAVAVYSFGQAWRAKNYDHKWSDFEGAFWKGYDSQNEIGDVWKQRVHCFVRFRADMMYFWFQDRIQRKVLDAEHDKWVQGFLDWSLERIREPIEWL